MVLFQDNVCTARKLSVIFRINETAILDPKLNLSGLSIVKGIDLTQFLLSA